MVTKPKPMQAFLAWIRLGFWVGMDASEAFFSMLPIGIRAPFQHTASAYEMALKSKGSKSKSRLEQIGYFIFQTITYIGVLPGALVGRYFVGPFFGLFSGSCFIFPGIIYGLLKRESPELVQFNWFTAQARRYAPVSIWGALGLSTLLSGLFVFGLLPNFTITLPYVQSQWSALGLIWVFPIMVSFLTLTVMGLKQWFTMTKNALTHREQDTFPLSGAINILQLSDDQKKILIDLFQQENHKVVDEQIIFSAAGAAHTDYKILLEELHFAKSLVGKNDAEFNINIENRRKMRIK